MKMKTNLLFLISAAIVLLSSCQKEVSLQNDSGNGGNNQGGGNNTSIVGDWDFVGLSVQSTSIVEVSDVGIQLKTVTTGDFDSKNNSGTIKITSNQFSYSNITYDVDTVVNMQMYLNGDLLSDEEMPYVFSPTPMSNATTYVRNTNDSLTLKNGIFSLADPSQGGPVGTGEIGMKISWASDTLLLKMVTPFSRTIVNQGVPGVLSGNMTGTMKLKKK